MKKIINYVFVALALLAFQGKALAEENKTDECKIIFYAETVYANKEVKLCRQGDTITYEFKNKNSADSIVKVTGDKKEFYISKDGDEIRRIYINAVDFWYALEEDNGQTTIWGYDGSGINKDKRTISKLRLYHAVNLKYPTLIFNRELVSDLDDFDNWERHDEP